MIEQTATRIKVVQNAPLSAGRHPETVDLGVPATVRALVAATA